ncbi:hypothetical protein QFC22_001359 [Naganishia vaughanmartiniae]|uniref:Uncharacterized protein n=1 Tax=Naganishia vaughanmartiniae TaxID=1424756 RepID=A0ACC2XIG6_9TREE|nr:hypothetical protein QFC22_001359 [Naganishia vaughanmartiniae]
MQNALPVWHTHSTISGDQTGLGISHELLRQSRAPNGGQGRTGSGLAAGADDGNAVEQDDLTAYYASLNAQPVAAGETNVQQQQAIKAERPTTTAGTAHDVDEEDDEMVDVSGGVTTSAAAGTSALRPAPTAVGDDDEFEETPIAPASASLLGSQAPTEMGEVDPATVVMVNGEAMTFAQVQDNEDLLDQMTADEYSAYFRLLDG